MRKIIAVVVTYNRLALLKECLGAIQAQSLPPAEIIVVNNNSTDGTTDWLATQTFSVINQENRGGSWGFFTGIKTAYQKEADWIWIMDDDTIPSTHALEELTKSIQQENIGFLASKVVWTDGTPHLMNLPHINTYNKKGQPFNLYDAQNFTLVDAASFVSLLVSRSAVATVGLPIKEFFIWHDDTEYTERITQAGFIGGYVSRSMALHKTPNNHHSNLYVDDVKNVWKYEYGIRNQLFDLRARKGAVKFWQQVLKRIFVFPFRILRKRKSDQWPFIKIVWKAAFNAINFNPEIEKP